MSGGYFSEHDDVPLGQTVLSERTLKYRNNIFLFVCSHTLSCLLMTEHGDVVYKLFQLSYRLRVRFLTISLITCSDHFAVDEVPDKLYLKKD